MRNYAQACFGSAFRSCQTVTGCFVKPCRWNDHCKHFVPPLYRAGWGLKSAQFPKVFTGAAGNLWILGQDMGLEWWPVLWTDLCLFLRLFFPNPRVKPKSWSWRTFDLRIMPATHARCLSAMSAASLTKPSLSSSQTPQVRGDTKGPCSPLPFTSSTAIIPPGG